MKREAAAREQLCRGAGLALIELSSILQGDEVTVDAQVDPLGMVLLAFAARGRRLLRSAYRLQDMGESAEAAPLLRVLMEYLIVARWLAENEASLQAWAVKGERSLLDSLEKMSTALAEEEDAATRKLVDDSRAAHKAALDARIELVGGEPSAVLPKIEQMAHDAGLGFPYQFAYRVQSQVDVHASILAAEAAFDKTDEGDVRLLPMARHGLADYDQVQLGAHVLLDLLAVVSAHLEALFWESGLAGVRDALEASRASDLRRNLPLERPPPATCTSSGSVPESA